MLSGVGSFLLPTCHRPSRCGRRLPPTLVLLSISEALRPARPSRLPVLVGFGCDIGLATCHLLPSLQHSVAATAST